MQVREQTQGFDLSERGRDETGATVRLDRRLFMQLQCFGDCGESGELCAALERAGIGGVLYEDLNDPRGVALLTFSEEPAHFVTTVRSVLNHAPFASLRHRPEMTMTGRTYAIGYEHPLEHVLLERPRARVTDPANRWAIWYPLRRAGAFERLAAEEQRTILREHGGIGRAFAGGGHALDIRLACHGLDRDDNDFVTGIVGPALYPLSRLVQRMRASRQTSEYLDKLGPFFVGRAIWQHDGERTRG